MMKAAKVALDATQIRIEWTFRGERNEDYLFPFSASALSVIVNFFLQIDVPFFPFFALGPLTTVLRVRVCLSLFLSLLIQFHDCTTLTIYDLNPWSTAVVIIEQCALP